MKNKLKIGAAVGTVLALAFLSSVAGAQTPGDSKGNGQNPLDQNDNGPEAVATYRGNSSDALVYNTAMDDYNHKNYKDCPQHKSLLYAVYMFPIYMVGA